METLIEKAFNQIQTYDWNSPFTLVIVFLGVLLLWKKWSMFFILFFAVVFGCYAGDLIVWSLKTAREIIGVPVIIYIFGGLLFVLVSFVKFTKYCIE